MPSESMIVRSSNSTLAGRAGVVPVAITILSALMLRRLPCRHRPRSRAAR